MYTWELKCEAWYNVKRKGGSRKDDFDTTEEYIVAAPTFEAAIAKGEKLVPKSLDLDKWDDCGQEIIGQERHFLVRVEWTSLQRKSALDA